MCQMDLDLAMNASDEEQLQVEVTDDSCRVDCSKTLLPTTDTDDTTECVSGDWIGEVKQENLAVDVPVYYVLSYI